MTRLLALVTALCLALPTGLVEAEAAQPPRVKGYACYKLKKTTPASSIWNAMFTGQREGPFDVIYRTRQVRCFKTEANCKAWVYWIQSDWPLMNWVRRCRRGLP